MIESYCLSLTVWCYVLPLPSPDSPQHGHSHTHAHTYAHMCACTHTLTCIHMHTPTHTCAHLHTHTHWRAHTLTHTHTCAHTLTHTLRTMKQSTEESLMWSGRPTSEYACAHTTFTTALYLVLAHHVHTVQQCEKHALYLVDHSRPTLPPQNSLGVGTLCDKLNFKTGPLNCFTVL